MKSGSAFSFVGVSQILKIKGLLDGTIRARYPDLTHGGLTFKKAKKEKTEKQLTLGDDIAF